MLLLKGGVNTGATTDYGGTLVGDKVHPCPGPLQNPRRDHQILLCPNISLPQRQLLLNLHALLLQNTAGAAYGGSGDPYGSGGAGVVDSQGGGMGEHLAASVRSLLDWRMQWKWHCVDRRAPSRCTHAAAHVSLVIS